MRYDFQMTPFSTWRPEKWIGFPIPMLILPALLLALMLAAPAALAEPRLALVIGNSAYGDELGRLPNPANDAKLMSKALENVGFETVTLIDADQKQLKLFAFTLGAKPMRCSGALYW